MPLDGARSVSSSSRRKPEQRLWYGREQVVLGQFLQRRSFCIKQRIRRRPILYSLAPRAAKAWLAFRRSIASRFPWRNGCRYWLPFIQTNPGSIMQGLFLITYVVLGAKLYISVIEIQLKSKRKIDKEASRIERLNLQLFQRNQSIVEENARLRKQALLLTEENQLLQQKLQEQLRCPDKVLGA